MPTQPANLSDAELSNDQKLSGDWTTKAGNVTGWISSISGALAGLFSGNNQPAAPAPEEKPKPKAAMILGVVAVVLLVVYYFIKRKGK